MIKKTWTFYGCWKKTFFFKIQQNFWISLHKWKQVKKYKNQPPSFIMRTSWKIHLGRSSDIMTRRLRPWSSKPRIKRLDRIYLPKTLILGYLVTSHKVCRGLHESLDLSFFIYKNCKISVKLSFSFYNNFIICYMYSLVINVILSVFWYFKLYNPYISIQIYCLRNRNV